MKMGECESSLNISINTTQMHKTDDENETVKFLFYGIIAPTIIALGLLGNTINLCVFRLPILKGVTYVYLKWLAISDIMSLLFYITFLLRILGYQLRSYMAAVYYAHFELTFLNAFMASSMFIVTSLTFDRYFSICLPTKFQDIHNQKLATCAIAMAFISSLVLYLPMFFAKYVGIDSNREEDINATSYIPLRNTCLLSHRVFQVYVFIKELCVRIVPILTIAILNTQIIVAFRKTVKKRRCLRNKTSDQDVKVYNKKCMEEKRLVSLLVGVMVLTFICKIPGTIQSIFLTFIAKHMDITSFGFLIFTSTADNLEVLNHALNFCVYCACSSQYRKALLTFVTCFEFPRILSSSQTESSSGSGKNRKSETTIDA